MDFSINSDLSENVAYNNPLFPAYVKKGILINSRQLHFGFSKSRQECEFVCILLHPDLLCANDWFRSQYLLPFLTWHMPPYLILSEEISWHADILHLTSELSVGAENELSPFLVQSNFFKFLRFYIGIFPVKQCL